MALHNGYLRMTGRCLGPATGDPRQFTSFAQMLEAYKIQVAACVELIARGTKLKDQAYAELLPCPFVSTLLKGCIENGRDMTRGGAQYNFDSISGLGLATAVNSLAAIRRFVFEEKSLTMADLLEAIDTNFQGREVLRQRLKNHAPKYGNDQDEVDRLARELQEFFCREVMTYRPERGGIFRPSFFSYGMHVVEGQVLGATPDGLAGGGAGVQQPFALQHVGTVWPGGSAPERGPAQSSPDPERVFHQPQADAEPDRHRGRTQKNRGHDPGLFQAGRNAVPVQRGLRPDPAPGPARPGVLRDLVVRVSGYSAYFTDLGKPVQDDIIARCSFDRVERES